MDPLHPWLGILEGRIPSSAGADGGFDRSLIGSNP